MNTLNILNWTFHSFPFQGIGSLRRKYPKRDKYELGTDHLRVGRHLLRLPGVDVNAQDNWGCTALHYAARNHEDIKVEVL